MTFGWSVWNNSWLIPGWFGAEDHGAGIALGDIDGSGRPDLVVFHVDNPGGENQYAAVARPLGRLPRPTKPQRLLTSDLHRGTRVRRYSLSARKADYPQNTSDIGCAGNLPPEST